MVTKVPPKTREQKLAARQAELEWLDQQQAYYAAEEAERQKERAAFLASVQAYHEKIDSLVRTSWAQREDRPMTQVEHAAALAEIEAQVAEQVQSTIPTLDDVYKAKRDQEAAAEAAAEAARIAAFTPEQLRRMTLPLAEQVHIGKWERINRMPWPASLPDSPQTPGK